MPKCKPMNRKNPIVTLVLKSVVEVESVGPDLDIEVLETHLGESFNVGLSTRERILAQFHYAFLEGGPIELIITVTEHDPVHDDSTTHTATLAVDFAGKYGLNGSETVTVELIGADEGPSAPERNGRWEFQFEWYLAPNVQDTIEYIHGEMIGNLKSSDFTFMQTEWEAFEKLAWYEKVVSLTSGEVGELVNGGKALVRWKDLVGYEQPWDHKPCIYAETGKSAFHLDRMFKFRFDIWSNVHYGYVGRAIGFSEKLLIDGAGLAQALKDKVDPARIAEKASLAKLYELDHEEDTAAIRFGSRLWTEYGAGLTKEELERQVLNTRLKIERTKTSRSEIRQYP